MDHSIPRIADLVGRPGCHTVPADLVTAAQAVEGGPGSDLAVCDTWCLRWPHHDGDHYSLLHYLDATRSVWLRWNATGQHGLFAAPDCLHGECGLFAGRDGACR
ncbi:hypothetical protein [Streptomyces catenulae]|uniref:Uncharacterized protein n=1 Tax=Streptomyces catenulae TaxID=66875 RepID=A0ABV2Z2H4_9ACTN|nr:hypothetical protein [Streptomyces catenulae]